GIGQIYKIGVNPSAPDNVLAGFQDNMSAEWNGKYWATLGYQDGTECAVDPVDSKYRYVSSIYGLIYRVYNSITTKIAGLDINGISENGGDLSPFLLSEGDTKTMVIGCNNIWISHTVRNNGGVSWRKISDNLAGSNYYYVMVMEQSPADTNVLYFTREDGKLFRTDNLLDASEVKWTLLPNSLPLTISEGIQPYVDIECHPYDANTVYLVNYKKVYKSIDKGLTLEDITGSLPDIPLTTIVYDKTSNEGLYLGSDAGVYYKDADMPDWILYGQSLPVSVKVTELEISYDSVNRQNSRLYASTFGRGVWETGLAEINPVPPPKQLIASATGESVDLTWIAPFTKQIISSYRIYRNDISLATTNNLNYTDQTVQKDVTYYYKVTALYQTGAESGFSNEVFATVITPVVLPYIQLFENGTAGWTAKYTLDGWKYGTSDELGITGRDGHFFGINSYEAGPGIHVTDCLRTPEINLSLYQGKTVTLNFAYTMQREINYDKFSVIYRQAPDSAWITLKSLEPTDYFDWVWDITELKLPEKALTPHAQIGFLYDDSNQVGWGAAVDDVKIFAGSSNVNQVDKSTSVRIFPNPTKGLVTLELNTLLPDEVNLKVYSFIGQVVLEKTISCQTGITTETIDLSSQPQGIYMLSLKSKSGSWQQKNTIILYPENVRRK
ncbi:MAG: T9SS type A sorting domain-containing protein, partial [Bacteroidia bacterium]|nr:T9SS type A sorting domain-containing protein [Bacteroidia bacterium]